MANDRYQDYPNRYGRGSEGYRGDDDYGRARDYGAGGQYARDDRNFRGGGTGYGDDRPDNGGGREIWGAGDRDYYGGHGGQQLRGEYGPGEYRGSAYGDRHRDRGQSRGRPPQGYDYEDRGFMARAGDEVRSWFGDEEAERRREYDQRYDERFSGASAGAHGRDSDYHGWRRRQMEELDRDYHEYRQENAKRFESEFGSWRSNRQSQRASLGRVTEHMEVIGSDGGHVGTVDKVRGDRIILTKSDSDAGGRHHSIPSSWLQSVDERVTIGKTADEAHRHWRDEETAGAMFGGEDRSSGRDRDGSVNLNRSFSGTY